MERVSGRALKRVPSDSRSAEPANERMDSRISCLSGTSQAVGMSLVQ